MPLTFLTTAHRHNLWGGSPGPQSAPWPACAVVGRIDSSSETAGPGGPAQTRGVCPTICAEFPIAKGKWHCAWRPFMSGADWAETEGIYR